MIVNEKYENVSANATVDSIAALTQSTGIVYDVRRRRASADEWAANMASRTDILAVFINEKTQTLHEVRTAAVYTKCNI